MGHLPHWFMNKLLFILTVLLTTAATAQNNLAVQMLVFEVPQINKAGFSILPFNDLQDRARGRLQKGGVDAGVPVATTSFKWVSTTDGKKVSFQTTGASKVLILGRSSAHDAHEFAVHNTTAIDVTLSTIGKSGSIDLEICREPEVKGDTPEGNISKIVYTLTSS